MNPDTLLRTKIAELHKQWEVLDQLLDLFMGCQDVPEHLTTIALAIRRDIHLLESCFDSLEQKIQNLNHLEN